MSVTQQSVQPESATAGPHLDLGSMLRESTAYLERLPEGLEFPTEYGRRISFDPDRRELVFRGFMSVADYCMLQRLSDDKHYHQALEQLHEHSGFHAIPQPLVTSVPAWLWALVAACFVAAGLMWCCWLTGN